MTARNATHILPDETAEATRPVSDTHSTASSRCWRMVWIWAGGVFCGLALFILRFPSPQGYLGALIASYSLHALLVELRGTIISGEIVAIPNRPIALLPILVFGRTRFPCAKLTEVTSLPRFAFLER